MEMTNKRREMMLKICDNYSQVPPYLYHLNRFNRCDEILAWLIKNNLTGKNFVDWVKIQHGNSILTAGSFILGQLTKEKNLKPIYGGRDYIIC